MHNMLEKFYWIWLILNYIQSQAWNYECKFHNCESCILEFLFHMIHMIPCSVDQCLRGKRSLYLAKVLLDSGTCQFVISIDLTSGCIEHPQYNQLYNLHIKYMLKHQCMNCHSHRRSQDIVFLLISDHRLKPKVPEIECDLSHMVSMPIWNFLCSWKYWHLANSFITKPPRLETQCSYLQN